MELYMLTTIDLFSGAGGMALGMEYAGFKHLLCVENNKDASNTLRLNLPLDQIVSADIQYIDFTEYKDQVDLVTGGPPCQSFSVAGKRRGTQDSRGELIFEFVRAVSEILPRAFLLENVKGLLTADKGELFDILITELAALGYDVQWKVLNAWDYAVAQKRERLFVVGVRSGVYEFPEPVLIHPTLRQALRNVPISRGASYSAKEMRIFRHVPPGGNWKNLPKHLLEEYAPYAGKSGGSTGIAKRLSWDEPCPTLLTSPKGKTTARCHPDHSRPLTIREYARIQTFPDAWLFSGSLTSAYRQIGNAVPVNLAFYIGSSLQKVLI